MMASTEQVANYVLDLLAVYGGAGVIGVLSFQYLGKKWIENKFAQRLDVYKHQQNKELSRLRIEIDSLLSGALKLQEREFELLPEAWEKLDEAYGLTRWAMSPGQISVNVGAMTNDQLDEYLATTDFLETQKTELRSSSNRDKTLQEVSYWNRLEKANRAVFNLDRFIARNGIFFPLELKQNFVSIVLIFRSSLISHEVGHGEPTGRQMQREGWKKIEEEAEPLYKKIEEEIQVRLRSHGTDVNIR